MRSILFFCISLFPGSVIHAQDSSFTDYYFKAKALAENLKTYQILVQAHNEEHPFVPNDHIKNEVLKSFNFLNNRKRVEEKPDFIIRIIVSDVNADVDYFDKEKSGDYENYEIKSTYDVSFALSFATPGKDTAYLPLCTKKHYENRFIYSRKNPDFDSPSQRYITPSSNNSKTVYQYVNELRVTLNTKATFLKDFNDELARFRNKK